MFCFAIVHNLCSTEIQICAINFYWEYDDKCMSIIIADENCINSGCIIYLVSIAVFMSTISLLQVLKFASNKMCTCYCITIPIIAMDIVKEAIIITNVIMIQFFSQIESSYVLITALNFSVNN